MSVFLANSSMAPTAIVAACPGKWEHSLCCTHHSKPLRCEIHSQDLGFLASVVDVFVKNHIWLVAEAAVRTALACQCLTEMASNGLITYTASTSPSHLHGPQD